MCVCVCMCMCMCVFYAFASLPKIYEKVCLRLLKATSRLAAGRESLFSVRCCDIMTFSPFSFFLLVGFACVLERRHNLVGSVSSARTMFD